MSLEYVFLSTGRRSAASLRGPGLRGLSWLYHADSAKFSVPWSISGILGVPRLSRDHSSSWHVPCLALLRGWGWCLENHPLHCRMLSSVPAWYHHHPQLCLLGPAPPTPSELSPTFPAVPGSHQPSLEYRPSWERAVSGRESRAGAAPRWGSALGLCCGLSVCPLKHMLKPQSRMSLLGPGLWELPGS